LGHGEFEITKIDRKEVREVVVEVKNNNFFGGMKYYFIYFSTSLKPTYKIYFISISTINIIIK